MNQSLLSAWGSQDVEKNVRIEKRTENQIMIGWYWKEKPIKESINVG